LVLVEVPESLLQPAAAISKAPVASAEKVVVLRAQCVVLFICGGLPESLKQAVRL
jgi:hypothetical protein